MAWGLPGGSAVDALWAQSVAYPVAAVLRVRRHATTDQPELVRASASEALFIVRESVECADASPGGEDRYLASASDLCSRIPVGYVATVLAKPHTAELRASLQRWRER